MKKFELSISDTADVQQNKIVKWREMFSKMNNKEKKDFLDFIYNLLNDTTIYDWNVYRIAVYTYQYLQQNNLMDLQQQRKAFEQLCKLTTTEIAHKIYAFSNAISITLREFYNKPNFPKSDVKNAYNFIINNMPSISKGWGSNRCQRCWNKTLKDMLGKLGIIIGEAQQCEIFKVTNLNIFQTQLKESYDSKINDLLNNFYKKFFKNVADIRVHDISSKDKNIKKEDRTVQKQGIDKTITLNDGTQIFLEEKSREPQFWENRKTDILLEYISIDTQNKPGWVYTSRADYLAILYKNINIKKSEIYIFPFKPIREWVKKNNVRFMSFPDIIAHNVSWNTISKAVPLNVVLDEMLANENPIYRKLHKLV
ncbi:MAG: hypothetical protein J6T63_06630 [Bacteroidales bacterium]|nr:hypothetical protein [Bacteroidales bacterium]